MLENVIQALAGAKPRGPLITSPSSSRMLASYLTDIEQMLDEQRWDAALRDAADLPRIAVALSDPLMRTSSDEVADWCNRWATTGHPAAGAAQQMADRAGAPAPLQFNPGSAEPSVPAAALRRLQLRRHARSRPRGFVPGPDESIDPRAAEAVQAGRTLVEAARRWYARSGVHDGTVQTNLARLAVLR
jgi:hypothetical protein